jgi:hypothetical protein
MTLARQRLVLLSPVNPRMVTPESAVVTVMLLDSR